MIGTTPAASPHRVGITTPTPNQWTLFALGLSLLQPLTKAVDIKSFHKLCEHAVAEQDSGEPGEIGQRQRYHSQMRAQRRERQINAESHDRGRQQNDWCSGSTLDEGDMLGEVGRAH